HFPIAIDLRGLEIVQQTTTLPHHAQQTATRRVIALVNLEVLGQVVDLLGEKRDLDLGRPRVPFVLLELADDSLLLLLGERHCDLLLTAGSACLPGHRAANAPILKAPAEWSTRSGAKQRGFAPPGPNAAGTLPEAAPAGGPRPRRQAGCPDPSRLRVSATSSSIAAISASRLSNRRSGLSHSANSTSRFVPR